MCSLPFAKQNQTDVSYFLFLKVWQMESSPPTYIHLSDGVVMEITCDVYPLTCANTFLGQTFSLAYVAPEMSCKLHSFASIMMLHLWPPRNRDREWRSSFHCQNKNFSMENKYQNFLSLCTPCWSSYNNLIVYLETAQLVTHSQTNQHIWYLWLFLLRSTLKGSST